MKLLVTGVAGFVGLHTSLRLLAAGHEVIGVDNLNDYYDPQLKQDRLAQLLPHREFRFFQQDVAEQKGLAGLFSRTAPERVIHLAAQAGVRYSLQNPMAYVHSNLVGFATILEACRHHDVKRLVYASSSSVYGDNAKVPFSETDPVDYPLSLYAASKRSNELMAHSYAHLYDLPVIGLRFFTVYGPWGRPDMAPVLFARAIRDGTPIRVFNHGKHQRDFTYVDDVVTGVVAACCNEPNASVGNSPPPGELLRNPAPFGIYNIGNGKPVQLMDFIATLEQCMGKKAKIEMVDAQPGDVLDTWADCGALERDYSYSPSTPLAEGMNRFAAWFKDYYIT